MGGWAYLNGWGWFTKLRHYKMCLALPPPRHLTNLSSSRSSSPSRSPPCVSPGRGLCLLPLVRVVASREEDEDEDNVSRTSWKNQHAVSSRGSMHQRMVVGLSWSAMMRGLRRLLYMFYVGLSGWVRGCGPCDEVMMVGRLELARPDGGWCKQCSRISCRCCVALRGGAVLKCR